MKKNVSQNIIISDPGIDDTIALFLYNKLVKSSNVTLITSFGNVPEDSTFKNGKEILGFLGNNWNIMHGAKLPLNGVVERPWPYYFHGPDGVWNTHTKVNTSKVKVLNKIPEIPNNDVISLSPFTDLSLIAKKYKTQVKNITVMGGVFFEEGNETPYAETNIAFDPDAAANFFNETYPSIPKVVPLDVTRKVSITKEEVNSLPENKPENIWMKEILKQWFINYNHEREENFNLHDPLAIYLHYFPEKANWLTKNIKVVTKGKKRGQTVIGTGDNLFNIAVSVKNSLEIKKEIMEILFDE